MSTYISEPKVYLVTRPSVDWEQVAAFLEDEGVPPIPDSIRAGQDESAAVVEISARMCYMSYGRGRRDIADFINNLLSSKDGSVFEHVNYGFVFTGVSRSLTHELVRHRAGFAYSQRSQRYVDETEGAFVIPPALAQGNGTSHVATSADEATLQNQDAKAILTSALESASKGYKELVAALETAIPREKFSSATDHRKAIRQAARAVLPNATETKIFVTANVRAWRHFIEMRGASYADWEIRGLAIRVLEILQQEAPLLFGDFTIEELPDGTRTAKPKYSKV
jgi:thymidylate synthase (FAD)